MSPGCCGLSADNRVPEGGLADGGGGAFLSRGGRQKAEAGELLSQSHSEENRQETHGQVIMSSIRLLRPMHESTLTFMIHLYLLCMMA